MHYLRVALGLCLLVCGCGAPDRAEIRYATLVFISPYATGEYRSMTLIDSIAYERSQDAGIRRADLPELYIRLDGEDLLHLPTLSAEQAAAALPELPAPPGSPTRTFFRPGGVQISLAEESDLVYLSAGSMTKQYDPGVEIASSADGPFYRFPLTREQIVELFGPPADEFARDYPHSY